MSSRCIVIGGGAAGMIAAYSAAVNGDFDEVLLLEKNEKLGKKVYITGKGRCNVTNDCEPEEFFRNIVSNPKFMYSAYYGFDQGAVMRLIERYGCSLKTERGNRVFPVSDHSSDVIKALSNALADVGVNVKLNTAVRQICVISASAVTQPDAVPSGAYKDDGDKRVTGVLLDDGEMIDCDKLILATGGLSYPSTGSTGDGHRWLEELGHTVTECRPALVPLSVSETDDCVSMQGLSLKNVRVRLLSDNTDTQHSGEHKGHKIKPVYEGFGEMLFTHFGVSGPLILSASSEYVKAIKKVSSSSTAGIRKEADQTKDKEAAVFTLHIDLKPALTNEQLDARVLRDFDEAKNKDLANVLGGLLPKSMIPVMIKRSGISADKKVHDITKQEREAIVSSIKDLTFHVTGTRDYNEAIITQGGVSVKEIDPSSMGSKLIKGLYIAGELLDVDAYTGGFNLQIAWSTGYLAGCSV